MTDSRMQWSSLLSTRRYKRKNGQIVPGVAVAKSDIDTGLRNDSTSTTTALCSPPPSAGWRARRRCIRSRSTTTSTTA